MNVKYPHINVAMVGEDGNVFAIMGRCQRAMRNAGCTQAQIDEFMTEMKSSDYDHALQTVLAYFKVDDDSRECPYCGAVDELHDLPNHYVECRDCGERFAASELR